MPAYAFLLSSSSTTDFIRLSTHSHARFFVLMSVTVKIWVCWDVITYIHNLGHIYQRFRTGVLPYPEESGSLILQNTGTFMANDLSDSINSNLYIQFVASSQWWSVNYGVCDTNEKWHGWYGRIRGKAIVAQCFSSDGCKLSRIQSAENGILLLFPNLNFAVMTT
jgi:hypothetical protein